MKQLWGIAAPNAAGPPAETTGTATQLVVATYGAPVETATPNGTGLPAGVSRVQVFNQTP